MLENTFLIAWPKQNGHTLISPDLHLQTYLAYPDDNLFTQNPQMLHTILNHHHDIMENDPPMSTFTDDFLYLHSVAIRFDHLHLLILPLPHQHILGLVFDSATNPYDYRNEVIRLLTEYLLQKYLERLKEKNKTNLLLTLFIDLRRYAEESLVLHSDRPNNVPFYTPAGPMVKVFVYGIDNAGKSSLMRLLATGKFDLDYFPPTKKFRISQVKTQFINKIDNSITKMALIFWDMPGQRIFREDWLRGAQASNILLFVLDLANHQRFSEAKEAFWSMLQLYELQELPLVFLANKTDLLTEMPDLQTLIRQFDLNRITDRSWRVIFTSLPTRQGIDALNSWFEEQASLFLPLTQNSTVLSK